MDDVLLVPTRYFEVLVLVLHILSVTMEDQSNFVTSSAHGPQPKFTGGYPMGFDVFALQFGLRELVRTVPQ